MICRYKCGSIKQLYIQERQIRNECRALESEDIIMHAKSGVKQSYAIQTFHVEGENRFALRPSPFNRYVEKPSVRPQSKLAASSTRARGTTSGRWCHIHWWAHTLSSETKRQELCKMSLRACFFTKYARVANRSRSHRPFGRCPILSCHPFHCYGIHIYRQVPTGRRKVQRNTT